MEKMSTRVTSRKEKKKIPTPKDGHKSTCHGHQGQEQSEGGLGAQNGQFWKGLCGGVDTGSSRLLVAAKRESRLQKSTFSREKPRLGQSEYRPDSANQPTFSRVAATLMASITPTQYGWPQKIITGQFHHNSPRPASTLPAQYGWPYKIGTSQSYQIIVITINDTVCHTVRSVSLTHHSIAYCNRAESPPQRFHNPNKLDQRDTPPPDLPQRHPQSISDVHDPDYALRC